MLFSSLEFFIFLGIVIILFFATPVENRRFVLLFSSIFFILSFSVAFLIYAVVFVLVNYYCALGIHSNDRIIRKFAYNGGLFFNIGGLIFFKYLEFIVENIYSSLNWSFPENHFVSGFILPIGISYYTYQGISYLYLVQKAGDKAEPNLVNMAIYMLFFPKVIAGPIERHRKFLPQLHAELNPNFSQIRDGGRLFIWGLFKMVIIGNSLGFFVNNVGDNIDYHKGLTLWLAFFLQPLYLYADFSGYTDMAIGSAKIFGIELSPNFRRPFLARNVSDFWRRWHISLSSWCNDFIFNRILLKYRKWKTAGPVLAVFTTFLVIGIWHGAAFTFVVLGILQGMAITWEFFTKRWRKSLDKRYPSFLINSISRILVYLFFSVSLVFFFSNDLQHAFRYFYLLITGITFEYNSFGFDTNGEKIAFFIGLFSGLGLIILDYLAENQKRPDVYFRGLSRTGRWVIYYVVIALYFYFIKFENPVVYHQF